VAITLLTRGGQAVKTADLQLEPVQGLVIGLGRTMISENPRVRVRLIDLEPVAGKQEARVLVRELTSGATDDEVAYRKGVRHSLRLERMALVDGRASAESGYRLDVLNPGVLDSMTFVETPRRKPGRGQVEVSIRAAALNFRDVMKALGIYPSDQAIDLFVGDECSGVVERVGPGVTRWKVGDRVIALGAGCFASHLTAPEELLLPLPDAMTFEEAATLPVAYMTAVHALCGIAGLKRGETVLIQAGSGGVGVAAIHLARSLGARVMATAGSAVKRDFLRGLGVDEVFDSRSLAFAEEVREATGGKGVDVVLNSLAGAAIEKGISCLAPYGRFVEIGKRDIYANTPVGLRPFRNNLSMTVVDLGQAMQDGGERLRGLLGDVARRIGIGKDGLPALPHRVFPMSRAKDAFRCMAQARHIGKIVLSARGAAVEVRPTAAGAAWRFDPEGVYVVTGGLSGFGREIGFWLLGQGVKHLYLVSRSGKPDEAVSQAIADGDLHGFRVVAAACDVTSRKAVDGLLAKIRSEGRAIRGIFHSAMVLEDKTLANMTPEQMTRVLAPKVRGTWNLHEATLNDPLDTFVMFSSVSSLLGNAGQGNYSAANAFLDSMAHFRRSRKLPALTVNWGQLGDVGVAASNEKLKESLTRQGILPLPFGRAVDLLLRLMSNRRVQSGVIPVDWKAFRSTHPQLEKSTRYQSLFAAVSGGESETGSRSARAILMDTPPAKRKAVMHDMLREEIAKVLRSSASKIRDDRPLTQLGLDSLMTFELIVRLEQQFEISLPPARMKEGTTLSDVAVHLLEIISGSSAAESGGSDAAGAEVVDGVESAAAVAALPPGCLVTLKKSGSGYPLFMIHPAGGMVGGYDAVAAVLPEAVPVFALQSRALLGADAEFADFDAMAAAYAGAILSHQKSGPVHLFGFSFGSWLAHAVATRIEAAGREVGWLGLVDPMDRILTEGAAGAQAIVDWHTGNLSALLTEFLGQLRLLTPAMGRELQPLAVELIGLTPKRRSLRLGEWLKRHRLDDAGLDVRLISFLISIQIQHTEIGRKAVLEPVRAPVVCWRGRHEWSQASDALRLGLGPVETIELPYGHFDFMVGDGAVTLGRSIAARISKEWKRGAGG
jgi:NADPH:quinone reductase-like Zn-dependent oxidoreductase/acyl carrier protein/pimeloyl-ACP methyl ester carboxylesterase